MDARPQPPHDDGREPQPRQIIRLADVEVRLPSRAGPVEILRGCNLVVSAGEAIGLVGPSGSGKTTLLMVIAGLETVTAGRVEVCGQDLTRLDEDGLARFRRDHVGVIFQSFHLIPAMTAWENVAVPLEFRGISGAMDIARQELTRVGLGHRLQHYPGQLSGGEQQRVAIARAMAAGAAVILADEPTGNLDQDTGGKIMDLLFALQREKGTTLVLVTHDHDLVRRCDRVIELRDGAIADSGRPFMRTSP